MGESTGVIDGEPAEERAFDYDRTVALSDGVFSIALTLLVLNIGVPVLSTGHFGRLGARLLDHRSELESYALSFAVIAIHWVRHHAFFRGLDKIDTRLTVLNLAYLGFIAFLPYPTRVLGMYGSEPAAVALYASTCAILAIIAGLTRVYARRAKLLSESGLREDTRRKHWAITPAIFLVSIPIAFVSTTAAELTWLLLALPDLRRPTRARAAA